MTYRAVPLSTKTNTANDELILAPASRLAKSRLGRVARRGLGGCGPRRGPLYPHLQGLGGFLDARRLWQSGTRGRFGQRQLWWMWRCSRVGGSMRGRSGLRGGMLAWLTGGIGGRRCGAIMSTQCDVGKREDAAGIEFAAGLSVQQGRKQWRYPHAGARRLRLARPLGPFACHEWWGLSCLFYQCESRAGQGVQRQRAGGGGLR